MRIKNYFVIFSLLEDCTLKVVERYSYGYYQRSEMDFEFQDFTVKLVERFGTKENIMSLIKNIVSLYI